MERVGKSSIGREEPQNLADHQDSVRLFCGRDHLIGFRWLEGHWLFDKYVLACKERRDCDRGVQVCGKADVHSLDVRVGEQLRSVGVSPHLRKVELLSAVTEVAFYGCEIPCKLLRVRAADCDD